jgi:hypothetical protein
VLRQQLRGRRIRYPDAQRRRLAIAAKKLGRKALLKFDTLVTPQTLLQWYVASFAISRMGGTRRGNARPRRAPDIVKFVLRMPRKNSGWGYTRIRGALCNLGHDVGRNTIKRILLEAGLDPAPRNKRMSWSASLARALGRASWSRSLLNITLNSSKGAC